MQRAIGNGPSINAVGEVVRHQRAAAVSNLVYFGAFCWPRGNTDTRRAGTEPSLCRRLEDAESAPPLLGSLLDRELFYILDFFLFFFDKINQYLVEGENPV